MMDGRIHLDRTQPQRIVIAGHVDHGKSTLIGRLLNEVGALSEAKIAAVAEMSRKRGMPFEWSFVIDAMQAERDQGITIDTSEVTFRIGQQRYAIIDAPGHHEFLRNMVTGAATADAAVAVVDVTEGAMEQSRRHLYLLRLLGVQNVVIVVNKMDLADYDEQRFTDVRLEIMQYLKQIGIVSNAIIPVAARDGDMIARRGVKLNWYTGPTLLEALNGIERHAAPDTLPLRFAVQDIYKFDERRIVAGRVESGTINVGDKLISRLWA